MQVRRIVLHRKGEKLRNINRHSQAPRSGRIRSPAVYKRVLAPNMLIGPQNLSALVNHIRSRMRLAAEAAGRDPNTVTLVAVSKGKTAENIRLAATAGVTDFGENYLSEALPKLEQLGDLKLTWHFIGQIQSNKTRPIARAFAWVHSIDRIGIARRLSEQRPF